MSTEHPADISVYDRQVTRCADPRLETVKELRLGKAMLKMDHVII